MKQRPAPLSSLGYRNPLRAYVNHMISRDKRWPLLQKPLLLMAFHSVLLSATAMAQESPKIQWELVNPFRFIHDQKTVDELRTIYDRLSEKSAAALERKLQDLADAEVDEIRSQARTKYDCEHTNSKEEKKQCFAAYSGWFARLAVNHHDKTCWNSDTHEYRRDGVCKDYVYPKTHRVRVWVTNPESLPDGASVWTLQPALPFDVCKPENGRRFCIEFNVPYQPDALGGIQVTAQFPAVTLQAPEIKVIDKFIVGLGDSYAAGEGSPDIPAQFIDEEKDTDIVAAKLAGHEKTFYPKKDEDSEAVWLDKRCHRSMYSYQFKTALRLALDNPREAVTYVSFSCSGAVTPEIIDKRQKAKERGLRLMRLEPQLEALRKVLQNGANPTRPIDYLLLSTGGNDIGFADYVAYILLRQQWLARLAGVSEKTIERDYANKKIEKTLWGDSRHVGNYRKLQKALFKASDKPKLIRIAGCEAGNRCDRVLLTPYPNVFTAENGRLCEGDRLAFDDAFGSTARDEKIKLVFQKVFAEIKTAQSSARIKSELGWSVVEDNVELYVKHGFCARSASSTSIGEIFQIPKCVNGEWTDFAPRNYRAYQTRTRWLRLPVDSKLTADQAHNLPFGIRLHVAFEDVTSSVMHPTAEGLATTADLNVSAIRKMEPIPQ